MPARTFAFVLHDDPRHNDHTVANGARADDDDSVPPTSPCDRRIARIRELQQRSIGLVGSGIIAALIGVSNFVARVAYDTIYEE